MTATCEHGIRHPWACEQCDEAAYRRLVSAAPKIHEAATKVLAWWDEKLANELSSNANFPWAEDAEWSEFNRLRSALNEANIG